MGAHARRDFDGGRARFRRLCGDWRHHRFLALGHQDQDDHRAIFNAFVLTALRLVRPELRRTMPACGAAGIIVV